MRLLDKTNVISPADLYIHGERSREQNECSFFYMEKVTAVISYLKNKKEIMTCHDEFSLLKSINNIFYPEVFDEANVESYLLKLRSLLLYVKTFV